MDLGTGAHALGRALVLEQCKRIHVLLSHTHIDHFYALPYFEPVFSPSAQVRVGIPADSAAEARAKASRYLNGVYHPLRLDDLGSQLRFFSVPVGGPFKVGPYDVRTMRLMHPGGTLGYRVTHGGKSVCYLTDTGALARPDEGFMAGGKPTTMESELVDLVSEADLLVMDSTFTEEEYMEKMTWGHCYPEYCVRLGEIAGVKQVALFHHSPDATDVHLDAVGVRWERHTAPSVFLAKEGLVVDLEG